MFKRLVANLPFAPSMVEDVALYEDRLRNRAAARGVGLMFIGLGLLLQIAIAYLESAPSFSRDDLAAVLAVGVIVLGVSAYLSLRNRIMALELEILRLNYLSAGGL